MEKIYKRLLKEGISPNQSYLLFSIRENTVPVMINEHLEIRGLSPDWIEDGKLTGKALSLLIDLEENFKGTKTKNDSELMGLTFKDKIEEYRLLFPDSKLPSGKYARDNAKNLEQRFRWFFKNHEYTWDTILKATEKYVEEYRLKDWNYMRTSGYFIKKSEKDGSISSDMANYCENLLSGGGQEKDFHFPDNIV